MQKKNKIGIAYTFKKQNQKALISFVDNKTIIPLAISYQREWSESFNESEMDLVLFSSGIKLSSYFGLGLSIEKRTVKNNNQIEWDGNLGSIFLLGKGLSAGFYLNHLLKEKTQRMFSLACYYNWNYLLMVKIDVSRSTEQKWIYKGALESFIRKFISIQLGTSWKDKEQKGMISGGITFQSPKINLGYGIETEAKSSHFQHAFSLFFKI